MNTRVLIFSLALFAAQTLAFENWKDLRVKWDFTPTGNAYERLPRNTVDAVADGWTLESETCTNGGRFNGFRWMLASNNGVSLLFDTRGDVAGMQTLVPQIDMLEPETGYRFDKVPMYQNDTIDGVTYLVITVYFINPVGICRPATVGPSEKNIGANSQVYFQNGPSPAYLKHAPKSRTAAVGLGWTINQCVPGMGWHNFYEVEKYMEHNCTEVAPTCILFDENDNMFGYCLSYPGMTQASDRWEHPSSAAINAVLGNAPQCILDQADNFGATTTHIYFTNTPWLTGC